MSDAPRRLTLGLMLSGVVGIVSSATVLIVHAGADHEAHAVRPGAAIHLSATAYCHAGKTAAGTRTHTGIVAADPRVLPVGSVLRIVQPGGFAGIYTVMDTGGLIKGRDLDIFIPNCARAARFGRRPVQVRVLRRGWDPKASGSAER